MSKYRIVENGGVWLAQECLIKEETTFWGRKTGEKKSYWVSVEDRRTWEEFYLGIEGHYGKKYPPLQFLFKADANRWLQEHGGQD